MTSNTYTKIRRGPQSKMLYACVVLTLSFFNLGAQNSTPKKSLYTIEQQLKKKQAEYHTLTQREKKLITELQAIEDQIQAYKQRLQEHQRLLKQKIAEVKTLGKNLAQLQKTSHAKKIILAKRLRAIYKMGALSYITPLLTTASTEKMQQHIKYLQLISKQDQQLISEVEQDRQKIIAKKEELERQNDEIAQTQKQIQTKQAQIAGRKKEQEQILHILQLDKQQYAREIAQLESSRKELERLIQNLTSSQPTPTNPTIPVKPGKNVTVPKNQENVIKGYGKFFRSNKGKLLWPVEGKILTTFGNIKIPDTKTYTHYKGVDILSPKGTPFYAVFKGEVKYADWFKGYGNLIIIDHGGHYYTLYAHADQILVKAGSHIETRQLLGKVGETETSKGPHLYFEVRANGKPEDPQRWLTK